MTRMELKLIKCIKNQLKDKILMGKQTIYKEMS